MRGARVGQSLGERRRGVEPGRRRCRRAAARRDPVAARASALVSGRSHGLPITRRRGLDEQLADDALGRDAVELRLRVEQQTVREHGLREHLDVIRDHVVPPVRRGEGLGRADERERAAHADSEPHLDGRARRIHQPRDVVVDGRVDVNGAGELAPAHDDLLAVTILGTWISCAFWVDALEDAQGRRVVRVADGRLHQEPVELGLGQAVGSGLLDRILRGDDHERLADAWRDPVDGDAPLLHDLEQRRLGLRAGAVDLVREHDVREDRAGVELEGARALVVDADAGDVTGQQVGRELDATGRAVDRLRHGARQRGLARAREVLEQQVALAEQRGESEPDDERLAQQHLLDVGNQAIERFGERLRLLGRHGHAGLLVVIVAPVIRPHIMVPIGADRDVQRREVLTQAEVSVGRARPGVVRVERLRRRCRSRR